MEKPFRKILVIKMRYHGDMLLTTPVISTLKQNYPDAKIDMLLYQDTIPILSENPEINALYGISNKGSGNIQIKLTNALSSDQNTLRANNYDLVINLTDQWMVALLVRCITCSYENIAALWSSAAWHLEKKLYTLSAYTRYTYC